MLEILSAVLVPIVKVVFDKIAGKKLSDKEFIEYVMAHQNKRKSAGASSKDWHSALEEAKKELEKTKEV